MTDEHDLNAEAIRRLLYRRDTALARHRAKLARKLGVTDIEMLALVHLAQRGELAPSALASLTDLSSGGATALVQRLERFEHVARKPHPTDRRSTLISLTPKTAERLKETESGPAEALESATAGLTEPERLAVLEVLTRLAVVSEELDSAAPPRVEAVDAALTRPVPSLWA